MKIFIAILALIIGIIIGSFTVYIQSYQNIIEQPPTPTISLGELFKHTNTIISEDNYSCEGPKLETVGDVMASIYERSLYKARNMFAFGCYEQTCSLSETSCKPWQSSECGSRILRFELSKQNKIDKESFTCLDMP